MSLNAMGIIILATMAIFTLGVAALVLGGGARARRVVLLILLSGALAGGVVLATLFGYRLPSPELAIGVPVAVGLLTALGLRSLGYGLLAGLVVAAAML